MLHLLVDTSTWLDVSKRIDGQRWIVAPCVLVHQGEVELIVPSLVVDEFERNRERIEASMTASVAQRFKLIRQDLDNFGGTANEHAFKVIEDLAPHVPLIGAMTTRNFDEVFALLHAGGSWHRPTRTAVLWSTRPSGQGKNGPHGPAVGGILLCAGQLGFSPAVPHPCCGRPGQPRRARCVRCVCDAGGRGGRVAACDRLRSQRALDAQES